ncbi:MAG TPA: VCBS repeat-containing protein [Bacillota bacterium]|jgi:hypothetical protein|nr:VCBS repeat-containing protein [Bacillota bacterium]HOL09183.1 VCBS repeat-containing protein [Bacillota bacterium]HPO96858.1 VCBS repeat-containing protein [Bacillota bacterium]
MRRLLFVVVLNLAMIFGSVDYSFGANNFSTRIIKPQLECSTKPVAPPKCFPKPKYRPLPKPKPKPSKPCKPVKPINPCKPTKPTKPTKPDCPTKPPVDEPQESSRSINEPSIMWRGLDWSGDVIASLIGDVVGDSNNEVICFTADTFSVINGKTGELITYWDFQSSFPDRKVDINNNEGFREAILLDIDDNGKQEIILQIRYSSGSSLIAFDGSGEIIWVQETGANLAFGMNSFKQSQTNQKVIFTGSELRDALTGALLKSELKSGTITDLNNDQIPEIITADAIYNLNDQLLNARNTEVGTVVNLPIVADLNKDGKPEIILLTTNGLYVFNSDYSLKWYDNNCSFQEPFLYYEMVYKQTAVVADVNQDGQLEIIVRTFNGSYDDYDPAYATTTCYNSIGAKLWSFDSLFEPYNGIANPVLVDVLGDEKPELVLVDGDYIMTVYDPQDGEWLLSKPLFDYYFSAPAVSVGDVDGDQQVELVVSNICVGAVDVPVNIEKVVTPVYSVESNFIELTPPYSLVMPDGVLWAVGNQCLVYYDPGTGLTGKIDVDFEGEKPLLRQESSTEIGLWSETKKLQLGVVNTRTRSYQATKKADSNYRYLNPLQINQNKYYFTMRLDNGDTALYEEDLTTGNVKLLLDTVYIDKILGFIDSNTMLVNLDFGRIATLNLTTLNYTNIINQVACDDAIYLNGKGIILTNRGWIKTTAYDYSNNDLLFSYQNGTFGTILSKNTVQELIRQQTGVLLEISGITICKKDDDHLYLLAKVNYRNEFDPALPLEYNLNPAQHQLPYLMEFEISTRKLTYKGLWLENLKIGSFTFANGNIIYAPAGSLNTVRSYNLTLKNTVEYPVSEALQKQYPNARVVKIIASNNQVYVLLWEYATPGGTLAKNTFNHHLFKLNLANKEWSEVPISGVQGLINGMVVSPQSPDYLYLYTGQKQSETQNISVYELNVVTGYARPVYSYNPKTFIPLNQSLCTDQNNRLYFYVPNDDDDDIIKYYDLNTGEVKPLDLRTGSDGIALLGADQNYLYLSIHLTDEWNRVNTYRYNLTTDHLEPLWSYYDSKQIDPTMMLGMTHFGYLPYDFSEFGFNSENKLLYFTDTQNILSTVLEPQTALSPTQPPTQPPTQEIQPKLKPVLIRVEKIGPRTYRAVFGYVNSTKKPIFVPLGTNNHLNRFYFGVILPISFISGEHKAFSVEFDKSETVSWTLNGITVTASKENAK